MFDEPSKMLFIASTPTSDWLLVPLNSGASVETPNGSLKNVLFKMTA